jgi:cytochrome P450
MASSGPTAMTLPMERDHPFDPPAELRRLRAGKPVNRLAFPDGHLGWLVTGHATGRAVLSDPRFSARQELRHFPVRLPLVSDQPGPARPGWFVRMDPPEHTRLRRLLTGQFTVRRMSGLTPRIAEIADELLDAMHRQGPPADLVRDYALPLPSLVICELLGVPYAERDRFQRQAATMLRIGTDREAVLAAIADLGEFLYRLVLAKRAAPTDDLLGGLAAGGELTDEELTGVAMLLLIAGHETTANMLALGVYALLRNPEQLAALRANPVLVDGAVEELLRYLSIIHTGLTRTALEDATIEGEQITAGETVVISVAEANRDAGHFAAPDSLDITRAETGHLAFGHGIHQCLGQQLARTEMRVGYATLLQRFPGLRLAVPPQEVSLRSDMAIYGVHRLPVAW